MNFAGLDAEAGALVLETARISGVIVTAPLSWSVAPARVKIGLVIVLAFLAHGMGHAPAAESFATVITAVPFELLLGIAMGMVARLTLASAQIAGDLISPMLGLGIATLFDPHAEVSETAVSKLIRNFSLLLAILLGLHRVLLGSVIASFRLLPPGSVLNPHLATESLVMLSASAIATGVRLAIPVIAVLLATQIALAFISRAAPAMQIFSIGFAFTLVIGTLTLVVALPDMGHEMIEDMSDVGRRIEQVLVVFTER